MEIVIIILFIGCSGVQSLMSGLVRDSAPYGRCMLHACAPLELHGPLSTLTLEDVRSCSSPAVMAADLAQLLSSVPLSDAKAAATPSGDPSLLHLIRLRAIAESRVGAIARAGQYAKLGLRSRGLGPGPREMGEESVENELLLEMNEVQVQTEEEMQAEMFFLIGVAHEAREELEEALEAYEQASYT